MFRSIQRQTNHLRAFLADERGQDVVEYSLVLVLIGSVALIFVTGVGVNLASILHKIGGRVENVGNTIP